jgi:hypothetical protein
LIASLVADTRSDEVPAGFELGIVYPPDKIATLELDRKVPPHAGALLTHLDLTGSET